MQFESATSSADSLGDAPIQVVTQQAGEATVTLSRTDTAGSLQVAGDDGPVLAVVVGVNVGAVDQTVTFADGQSQATLTVPILAGAPNPGEVDVNLTHQVHRPSADGVVRPIASLDLKIVASDPTLPPKVVFMEATAQGILLSFNKPMNPAGASNVNNYAVKYGDQIHRRHRPIHVP